MEKSREQIATQAIEPETLFGMGEGGWLGDARTWPWHVFFEYIGEKYNVKQEHQPDWTWLFC